MITTPPPKLTPEELHAHLREIADALGCTVTGGGESKFDSHQYIELTGPRLERICIHTHRKSNGAKLEASIDVPAGWKDRFHHYGDPVVPNIAFIANKSAASIASEIRNRLYRAFDPIFDLCLARKIRHDEHTRIAWETARAIGDILHVEPREDNDHPGSVGKTSLKSPTHLGEASFAIEWVMEGTEWQHDAPPELAADIARLIHATTHH